MANTEQEFAPQWPELSLLCGAIPSRSDDVGEMQILLIRRRGEDAWSIPKGNILPGSTMARSAAKKAFHKAGVYGAIASAPLGSYRHLECGRGIMTLPRFVEVVLFPLIVEAQVDHWPEMSFRERRWFNRNEVRYFMEPRPLWHFTSLLASDLSNSAMNA